MHSFASGGLHLNLTAESFRALGFAVPARYAGTRRFRWKAVVFLAVAIALLPSAVIVTSAQFVTGPSVRCHVTDGAFTLCPDGSTEWSDVTPAAFSSGSVLYVDQADLDPARARPTSPVDTLMLMYDETQRTMPLAPDEYVLVHFMTVDEVAGALVLDHYNIHIFDDDTMIFFKNGAVQGSGRVAEIEGQRAAVTFGPSVNLATPHVIAEYQIELSEAGGASYSDEPLWWTNIPPGPCSVDIQGTSLTFGTVLNAAGTPTMNVGENAQFTGSLTGSTPGATVEWQWTVSGGSTGILKDYNEHALGGTPGWTKDEMLPADFQHVGVTPSEIPFYWKEPLGTRTVSVDVTIQNAAGTVVCTDSVNIIVERNAGAGANVDADGDGVVELAVVSELGINRQAVDFYTRNHPTASVVIGGTVGRVLVEHENWHAANNLGTPLYGRNFFAFHRLYIDMLNSWRAEFGYAPLATWDPLDTSALTTPEFSHALRGSFYDPATECDGTGPLDSCGKPTYFQDFPGVANGPVARASNGGACDLAAGQDELSDFIVDGPDADAAPDKDLLGCAVTVPWHNRVHDNVGGNPGAAGVQGSMASLRSPMDPIFWPWHNFVDGISQSWSSLSHLTPPLLDFETPSRIYPYVTRVPPGISVMFSEPVRGVVPSDLTMIGIPARAVSGSGAGPYTFSFFLDLVIIRLVATNPAPVEVRLGPGNITDEFGLRFAGDNWTYLFINSEGDDDADGVTNGIEANVLLTNPESSESEEEADGMPDGFEARNPCLDGLVDDANEDPDRDGLTNLQEFLRQTNPCPPPPVLPRPTFLDVDGDLVANDFDNCPTTYNPDQADHEKNGLGDACQQGVVFASAAFFQANSDGSTFVEPTSLIGDQHPPMLEQIVRIVRFRTQRDPTLNPVDVTVQLTDSQVALGILSPGERDSFINQVLRTLGVIAVPTFGDVAAPILVSTAVLLIVNWWWRRRRLC